MYLCPNFSASKVILSDVPSSITLAELEKLFANFGTVQSCEANVPRSQKAKSENNDDAPAEVSGEADAEPEVRNINVFYQSREDAEKAVKGLNETEVSGVSLSARLVEKKSPKRTAGHNGHNNGHGGGGGGGFHGGPNRQIDFPLRILVQSEMVGAIIGRGGQTIRQITQHSRFVRATSYFTS